jgi:hypothetical protein
MASQGSLDLAKSSTRVTALRGAAACGFHDITLDSVMESVRTRQLRVHVEVALA